MKIAVTYDNGMVFPHFGHTKTFKIYEAENGQAVSSEIVNTDGSGHAALAGFLKEQGVQAVICGGIGGGAMAALAEAGIEICSGAEGDADKAVEAFLKGELVSSGESCTHHDHEHGHDCGGHDHDCGHSCGHGNCGSAGFTVEGKNAGKTCRVHYKGTLNDGTQFDSSYDRGEPLEFVCGVGMMIKGFDAAVVNMEPGQSAEIHLMPEEAYGQRDPNAVFTIETDMLPGSEELNVGEHIVLSNPMGQQFPVVITAKEGNTITFDANHEMAGKELNFLIELLEVL